MTVEMDFQAKSISKTVQPNIKLYYHYITTIKYIKEEINTDK